MSKRIYLIKSSGALVNCSRGIADYELCIAEKTLLNTIVGTRIPYRRVEVECQQLGAGPRSKWSTYDRNTLIIFVADSSAANDTLLDVYRILDAHTGNMVFPVQSADGIVAVRRTIKGAYEKRDEFTALNGRSAIVTMYELDEECP